MEKTYNPALIQRTQRYMETHSISQNQFAAKVNLSSAALSSYLNQKYKGSVEAVERQLSEFFKLDEEAEAAAEKTASLLPRAAYVPTSISEDVCQSISLSIMDFQHLYYDALQAALRLGDQIGQAYRLCDASAWSADELTVTWGNGVLYDADQEWTERKELVQMGLLKPELALAWKFDLPAETEADLAEIRKNYMPELKDLEG